MYVRNTWYVAAWDHEVSRSPLARTILDIPLVFYRKEDGTAVALDDACPHRFYPLSKGRVKGDTIECGYHGMTFDCSGQCIRIPGQDAIPPQATVRSYPVEERWGWVWIWMGDPSLADPDDIIDIPMLRTGEWSVCRGERMYYQGSYQLMTDNLMDPSHTTYVHASTFGTSAEAELPVRTTTHDGFVTVSRIVPDSEPAPVYKKFGGFSGKVHRWQVYRVCPPSLCIVDTGSVTSNGEDGSDIDLAEDSLTRPVGISKGDNRTVIAIRGYDFLTPETETSTHYFWFMIRNFGLDDRHLERQVTDQVALAFREDLEVVEGIQDRINRGHLPNQTRLKMDAGYVQVHRMLDRMLKKEQDNIASSDAAALGTREAATGK